MKKKTVSYSMANMTDPEIQKLFGCHREGNQLVGSYGKKTVFLTFTPEEMAVIEKREAKRVSDLN